MDFNSQHLPHQPASKQDTMIGRDKQERIFNYQMETCLRQDFRGLINQTSYIQQQCFSRSAYIPLFEHEHQIISDDPAIETSFPTILDKQKHQAKVQTFDEVRIDYLKQDTSAFVKRFEEELIAEMKQIHPFLSKKQIEQADEKVVQFWQSHQVRPAGLGKILKLCVKILLLFQAYFNSNRCSLQRQGTLREFQQKYAGLLEFITETFDNQNLMLDKVAPLEKEYFVFKHLNLESFPDHKFNITSQVKKVRSKKKQQETPFRNATITLQSSEQKIASTFKRQAQR